MLLASWSVVTKDRHPRCLNVGQHTCETAAERLCPCYDPSQQFHCSSTCVQCCWAASLQLWTPGSPAAADGPWKWGPPAAGSRPAAGKTAHPFAGCLPFPAALQCGAAAAPGSPPAEGGRQVTLTRIKVTIYTNFPAFIYDVLKLSETKRSKMMYSFSPPPHSLEHLVWPASSDSRTRDGPGPPSARCLPTCQNTHVQLL